MKNDLCAVFHFLQSSFHISGKEITSSPSLLLFQTEKQQHFPWSFQLCIKAGSADSGARKVSPNSKRKRDELKQVSPLLAGRYQKNEKEVLKTAQRGSLLKNLQKKIFFSLNLCSVDITHQLSGMKILEIKGSALLDIAADGL